MSTLFESTKHVFAGEAAERAGIALSRKGGSYWCCCPLHVEKTPSMKFYDDTGGWYCFGCHKGGDAIKLYEELYRVEPVEAARMLAAAFGIAVDDSKPAGPLPNPKPTERNLEHKADQHYIARWSALCAELHEAEAVLKRLRALGMEDWDNPIFVSALRLRSAADDKLDAIAHYDITDKIQMYREEVGPDVRQGGGGPGAD